VERRAGAADRDENLSPAGRRSIRCGGRRHHRAPHLRARAYALARLVSRAGARVVLGGLHVLSCPDEAAPHATRWPSRRRAALAAHPRRRRRGALAPRYEATWETRIATTRPPRRDVLARRSFLATTSLIRRAGCQPLRLLLSRHRWAARREPRRLTQVTPRAADYARRVRLRHDHGIQSERSSCSASRRRPRGVRADGGLDRGRAAGVRDVPSSSRPIRHAAVPPARGEGRLLHREWALYDNRACPVRTQVAADGSQSFPAPRSDRASERPAPVDTRSRRRRHPRLHDTRCRRAPTRGQQPTSASSRRTAACPIGREDSERRALQPHGLDPVPPSARTPRGVGVEAEHEAAVHLDPRDRAAGRTRARSSAARGVHLREAARFSSRSPSVAR